MVINSFVWMLATTLVSILILFRIFKLTNEVIGSADIRPASMQIIFLLIITPIASLIVFVTSESWKSVEKSESLVEREQKAYIELHANYQTLLESIVNNNYNINEVKMLNYKKIDNYRNAVVNYQYVYMEKNYSFAALYPRLTTKIDQIEIDIMNGSFKDAETKLKEANKQLIKVRNFYLKDLEEIKVLAQTKLWFIVGILVFISVCLVSGGIYIALLVLYADKILVDVHKKLLKIEQTLSVTDKKIYLKIQYIIGVKYLLERAFRLFFILYKVYKIIETHNRLNCLSLK